VGQDLIKSRTGGSAQPVLNLAEVKALPIPLPPPDEQQAIVERLDSLSLEAHNLASSYRGKIAALAILKQSLLHRAFSGELTEREPLAA
jgi:type I restriction enzyme S subunit